MKCHYFTSLSQLTNLQSLNHFESQSFAVVSHLFKKSQWRNVYPASIHPGGPSKRLQKNQQKRKTND